MSTKLAILLVVGAALLQAGPATAGELFRAGVVSCVSLSRAVTALSVYRCNGGENSQKGEMFGSCEGSYVANRVSVPFVVSAYMRDLRKRLPDNKKALAFDYRGMRCQIQSWRVRSVHNCSYFDGGNGMQCNVCITLLGTRCYNARMAVTLRGR